MKMRRGVSVIELMMALIVFSLLFAAMFRVFSSSQRGAVELVENHAINEQVDRTLQRIMDDVRESNYIYDECPQPVPASMIASLQTEDPTNYLMFMKVLYDFTRDPISLPDGEVNYTQNRIRYFVEREDPDNAASTWVLMREMLPYDNRRQPIDSQMTVYPILRGISECIFYRVIDPDASRSGNLYVRLKMSRQDSDRAESQTYSNEMLISVKERGAVPQ